MINSRHIFMAPSEDVLVLPYKCCERLANWWASKNADPGHSLEPKIIKEYLFQPFHGFCHHPLFFYTHDL